MYLCGVPIQELQTPSGVEIPASGNSVKTVRSLYCGLGSGICILNKCPECFPCRGSPEQQTTVTLGQGPGLRAARLGKKFPKDVLKPLLAPAEKWLTLLNTVKRRKKGTDSLNTWRVLGGRVLSAFSRNSQPPCLMISFHRQKASPCVHDHTVRTGQHGLLPPRALHEALVCLRKVKVGTISPHL